MQRTGTSGSTKRVMGRVLAAGGIAVLLAASHAPSAVAADQTVLGKSFSVKDPDPGVDPSKRSLTAFGTEPTSDNTVVGDPVSNGATIEIVANGGTPSDQIFALPPGVFVKGGAGWKTVGNPVSGYAYKDGTGLNGPVVSAYVKMNPKNGLFSVKATVKAVLGPGPQPHVSVVPPAPGTDGGMIFRITGGDAYCVVFGGAAGGVVTNKPDPTGEKTFKIASSKTVFLSEAGCPVPAGPTTTTTSSTSTTSTSPSTTTSTKATTTTVATTSTTSTLATTSSTTTTSTTTTSTTSSAPASSTTITTSTSTTTSTISGAVCGNGIVEGTEQCDDGNDTT